MVFTVAMEEGLLPHTGNDDVEEERRVAHAGITRAKRIVGLTYATAALPRMQSHRAFSSSSPGRGAAPLRADRAAERTWG